MTVRLLRAAVPFLLLFVAATPAAAVPVDYTIFRTSSLSVLGTFTIDPSLAAPVGESNVNMTALTFTEEVPPFGDLTITLGDIDVGDVSSFRAIFLDGQIASISAIGPGDLPGGIRFFLDFTPNVPADPSLIDLNIVGSFALDASTNDIIGDSATGPIGISAATTTVPEPSTLVLTLLGALGLGAVRGRRRR